MFEHQAAFIETLRAGHKMRKRVFDTLEQRHAQDFGNGRAGMKLYEHLLSAVRDTEVAEATEEFENRFFPLLNPGRPRGDVNFGTSKEMINKVTAVADRASWSWISALCVAAVMLGALILGSNALKTAEPIVTEGPIPAAKVTEPVSETVNEPSPTTTAEQDDPSSER